MEFIPYEFIERTIVLASPPRRHRSSPFASLQGHWGEYAKVHDKTEQYQLVFHVSTTSSCFFTASKGATRVRIEDILQKKRINIANLTVSYSTNVPPEAEALTNHKKEILQRLLSRSNGLTTLEVSKWPIDAPELTAFLEAIPRIWALHLSPEVEDVSAVLSLVKKHLHQRCLKYMDFGRPTTPSHFSLVHVFREESKFSIFKKFIAPKEEDLAKEIMRLIAANVKERILSLTSVYLRASPILVKEFKKKLGDVAEQWPRRFDIADIIHPIIEIGPPSPFSPSSPSLPPRIHVVSAGPPIFTIPSVIFKMCISRVPWVPFEDA